MAVAADLKSYQQILPADGVAFLFSERFSQTLLEAVGRDIALENRITEDQVIQEFRRRLALKAFTVDTFATKISPTHLIKLVTITYSMCCAV